MKKIILQHSTSEQANLLNLSSKINKIHAGKTGFEHVVDSNRRCPDKTFYWEKIACIINFLPKVEDGSLIVWEDSDTINIKDESLENALPTGGILGMVQNRGGLGSSQLMPWFNAGVIVITNSKSTRDFFNRVWNRSEKEKTDEAGIMAELKYSNWEVSKGVKVSSIDLKWNGWNNNEYICLDPNIKSWHGVKFDKKLVGMTEFATKAKLI